MGGSTACFCPGKVKNFPRLPGLSVLFFSRPRNVCFFFRSALHPIISTAAAVPFFSSHLRPRRTKVCPAVPDRGDSCPTFSPLAVRRFFFCTSRSIFPSCYAAVFSVVLRTPDTTEFIPLRGFAALLPSIFPRSFQIFPRPLRSCFFPWSKVLRAPWVSHR